MSPKGIRLALLAVAAGLALTLPAAPVSGQVHVYRMIRARPTPTPTPTPRGAATRSTSARSYSQLYYGNEAYMGAYRRVIRSYNRSIDSDQLETIVRSILYYSYLCKTDPRFVVAVVAVESAFHPHAVSPAGAGGLGQLMPDTARELRVDPHVPYQNIQGTVRYLKLNLDRFKHLKKRDQMRMALASYNAGYGAVMQYKGVPPYPETQQYVSLVMGEYTRLSGER